MRKQTFDKIKKTLAILLAVFLVVSLTAASASACSTKNAKNKLASDKGDNKLTEKQKTELGNRLLDFADKNMFGNLRGGNDWNNDWLGDDWNNDWLGDDWNNDWLGDDCNCA
jgi:hypothetical protein